MPERKHDLINYVIGHLRDEEYEKLQIGIDSASKAVVEILKSGVDIAMNKFN